MKRICPIGTKLFNRTVQTLLCILTFVSLECAAISVDGKERKVIYIGIDGVQFEAIVRLDTPAFDRLFMSKLYAGGVEGDQSEQATSSGPGWTTLLTGVWANRHGVTENNEKMRSRVPSLFSWVNRYYPEAVIGSVVRWGTIYDNLYGDFEFADKKAFVESNDTDATAEFLAYLEKKPDFAFLHLDDIDHAGHEHGFGEHYDKAVMHADAMLGQVLDLVDSVDDMRNEYLIVVSTDHGRGASGGPHGGQSASEKTVFIATNKQTYHPAGSSLGDEVYRALPQTYPADVILDYLGIELAAQGCADDDLPCIYRRTGPVSLNVLQFNIWQEGTVVKGGYEAIIDEIIRADADLVALSEVRNYWFRSLDKRLLRSLKKRGYTYYALPSEDTGLLSKYPIKQQWSLYPVENDHGSITKALIDVEGVEVVFYSAHLDYRNCSSYLPRGYDSSTWEPLAAPVTDLALIRDDNAASMRDEAIDAFLADAKQQREQGRLVILAGDFNEPSHRDWTEATAGLFDHNGVVMPWRNTVALESEGYIDSYRELYPDPVTHPGFTFPADNPLVELSKLAWSPMADDRERIDFIFYHPDPRLVLKSSTIVGPSGSIRNNQRLEENSSDIFIEPLDVWPTDHKALLTRFELILNQDNVREKPKGNGAYLSSKRLTSPIRHSRAGGNPQGLKALGSPPARG